MDTQTHKFRSSTIQRSRRPTWICIVIGPQGTVNHAPFGIDWHMICWAEYYTAIQKVEMIAIRIQGPSQGSIRLRRNERPWHAVRVCCLQQTKKEKKRQGIPYWSRVGNTFLPITLTRCVVLDETHLYHKTHAHTDERKGKQIIRILLRR